MMDHNLGGATILTYILISPSISLMDSRSMATEGSFVSPIA